jgi:putative transcriptional regulator
MTPLKRIRKARGLTAAGVAETLQMDQGHYTRIENGASTSAETAAKIAALFSPEISELHVLYPDRFQPEGAKAA